MQYVRFALAIGLVSACLFATARPARADVPPPNMTCGDKKPGDSCVDDDKKAGTCTATKCSRMGAVPGPNGTTERKIVEYDCTLCTAASTAPATSGSPSSPSEKKGCNTSGTRTSDAGLFVLGALGRSRGAATDADFDFDDDFDFNLGALGAWFPFLS